MKRVFQLIPGILTWMLLLLTLVGGMARFIPPEIWAFPSVVCLIYPWLALLTLAAGIVWLCLRRLVLPIACGVTLLLTLPTLSQVCPVNFPSEPEPGAPVLKVLTYNVHYCSEQDRSRTTSDAMDYIINSGADVVCMQELYSLDAAERIGNASHEQVQEVKRLYPYTIATGGIDVITISKYPVSSVAIHYRPDLDYFMYEVARVDAPSGPVTFCNVHLTSFSLTEDDREVLNKAAHGRMRGSARAMKNSVYHKLTNAFCLRARAARELAALAERVGGNLIICGDFNDVPGSYAYTTIRKAGLSDAYADAALGPTVTFNGHNLFFHIDQMLYRGTMRPFAVKRGKIKASDHYPLMVSFEMLR